MTVAPDAVQRLAAERVDARSAKDFARSDELRDEIAGLGWLIKDTAGGYELVERPPFEVLADLRQLVASAPEAPPAGCTLALLVDGWPDDLETCVRALMVNLAPDVVVVALDCGDVDGAGLRLHHLAAEFEGRLIELHVDLPLARIGWAPAVTALASVVRSPLFGVIDMSTVLTGDGLPAIIAAFEDPSVIASGWRGVNVDVKDNWRTFTDAGPGEVDAVLGYLIVVRTDAAIACPPSPKAMFYRNADMEWSLALREHGAPTGTGRIVIPSGEQPIRQDRHHGYHDSEDAYRDKESKKTYERILQRFRGRTDLLSPRD
jgi:hypothetical protein